MFRLCRTHHHHDYKHKNSTAHKRAAVAHLKVGLAIILHHIPQHVGGGLAISTRRDGDARLIILVHLQEVLQGLLDMCQAACINVDP